MFDPPSCLNLIHEDGFYAYYNLEDTSYIMIYDTFYNKKRAWTLQAGGDISPGAQIKLSDVAPERVFEEAPENAKESLIFHMDLFV